MALTYTPSTTTQGGAQGEALALSAGYWLTTGTLTFSGSYATGGDTLAAGTIGKRIPSIGTVRELIPLGTARGNTMEYDLTNGKLKFYSAANTEMTAAAYNAALTATPVPVAFLVRV
jgi:hypothetical protein